jgi:hypothetical protein
MDHFDEISMLCRSFGTTLGQGTRNSALRNDWLFWKEKNATWGQLISFVGV